MSSGNTLWFSLLVGSLVLLIRRWYQNKLRNPKSLPLHPGPTPVPLLGNVLTDMPKLYPWKKIAEWKHKYGDIVRVQAFGNNVLFVNSWEAANELMNKRSTIYSDRPEQIMFHQVTGLAWTMFSLHYGDEWRQQRKIFHQYFRSEALVQFQPSLVVEMKAFLVRLLDSPESFWGDIFHMEVSTMMRVVYGIEVPERDNTYDNIVKNMSDIMAETGVPGTFMVDYFPQMMYLPEWFPGATFKKLGRIWKKEIERYRRYPFAMGKRTLEKGIDKPSALSLMLQTLNESQDERLSENMIRDVTSVTLSAGADTTASALRAFFLAMVLNTDIQRKAQVQVDAVVGKDKLPDFDDLPSLPYLEAILMEVLRYHPGVPFGLPHMNMEDDEYEGHFIPKGTTIVANAWAMLHDENAYPNPFVFSPERFLDKEGKIDPQVRNPYCTAFGYGRRICPGRHMAMSSLMITMASILSIFDIEHAVDDQGDPIPIQDEVSSGLVTHPLPFKCSIKPRKTVDVGLIRRLLA